MSKKKKTDPYFNLKYAGYCMSQMPPEGALIEFDDFVKYAKFRLCRESGRLMKDPIWEDYLDEEILMEYYAHLYEKNEEERAKIEAVLSGLAPDVVDWFDDMIEKNKKDLNKYKEEIEELEDEVSFKPDEIGE